MTLRDSTIETKLILVEGVPCSGKSTTAKTILSEVTACGNNCHCYLEWGDDNPIDIGNMEDLAEIISTRKTREENVLQQWKRFAQIAKRQETINIIESRFWQTDAMYLYLSGHSEQEIFESNRRAISVITELDPVLIYLAPIDIEQLHTEIAKKRNEKWRESGRDGSWEEWGNSVYEQQRWFTDRSLNSTAMARFFNEWASIADRLYERFPYRKLRIQDPHTDWENTNSCIRDFLEANSQW
jgi:thymidylate kinase